MPLLNEYEYTINDIYGLPDGQRAELMDGKIYMMAPPSTTHQRIVSFLHWKFANYINGKKGQCEVFPAPFAVFLNADDKTYVEPDLAVICDKDKLDDKGCHGAPDLIVEVVSPASQRLDYMVKLFKYRTAGVKEYWIVDPKDKTITVYDFSNDDVLKYNFASIVTVNLYGDLEINFAELSL